MGCAWGSGANSTWSSAAPAPPYSAGAAGDLLVSNGSTYGPQAPASLLANTTLPQLVECLTDPAVTALSRTLSGTGQIFSVSGTGSAHPGQWALRIGSGTGSRAGLYLGPSAGGMLTPDVAMAGFWEVMLTIPTVNGGGQTFELFCGFADNAGAANVSNGTYWYVNSSNELRARRIVGGVVGVDTLATTMQAGLWFRLRTTYTSDNVVLGWAQTESRTAPLTTAATLVKVAAPQSPQVKFVRLLGSSTRDVNVDSLSWYLPKV